MSLLTKTQLCRIKSQRTQALVNARIEPKLKNEAEHILHKVGLTSAEAVRLLMSQFQTQQRVDVNPEFT